VAAEPLPAGLAGQITHVDDATGRLLAGLARLAGTDPARPSLCAGWTVGHVLTHLARNADGLRRGAEGARRGEQVPMYDSLQARTDDIESGAARTMAELTADVITSAAALRRAWSGMQPADWARAMTHHRAGLLPLSETPGMRLSELEIHHIDLGCGFGPAAWPGSFVAQLLSAIGRLPARLPAGVRVDVRATDTGARWSAGPDRARRVDVSGPSWAIAAWLAGRPAPAAGALSVAGGALPALAPWP
jgi:maleylpyruvate isomerase